MAGIFGKSNSAKTPTAAGALQLQTAQRGAVIPLVYGTTRVAGYILDYDDFRSFQTNAANASKGKGGAGGGKAPQAKITEYSASFIIGYSQGQIAGIGQIWYDKFITTADQLQALSSVNLGGDGQAADPYWASVHNDKAIGYSGTANFVCANYILGPSATLPNFSAEIGGVLAGSAPNGQDCDPSQMLVDFASNPRYGAGFPADHLDPTIANPLIPGSYAQYVRAMGLWHSISLETQSEAQQHLDIVSKLTNSEVVWSGGLLKIVPRGERQVTGQITQNASWQITLAGGDQHAGNSYSVTIADPGFGTQVVSYTASANQKLPDVGSQLVRLLSQIVAQFNIIITSSSSVETPAPPTPTSQNNSAIFRIAMFQDPPVGTTTVTVAAASDSASISVSTTSEGGVGTYSPNTSPVYSLVDGDFIVQASSVGGGSLTSGGAALRSGGSAATGGVSDDPVKIARTSPADAANLMRLECLDRGAFYNTTIVEVSDQAAVDQYGLRAETPSNARSIVDPYVGYITAQLLLQRSLLYRNSYTFRLGWKYILLEPMDLVQITDPALGAASLTVRITGVQEDEEGTLTITAEDWIGGVAGPLLYPRPGVGLTPFSGTILGSGGGVVTAKSPQLNLGVSQNFGVQVGSVNPPVIFEPPEPLLTSPNALEIWIAISNSYPNYGGVQVWMSLDGDGYASVGTILGSAVMGLTTTDLPTFLGANPDAVHTLAVDLTQSAGTLTSVSPEAASNFVSLLYVGGEAAAPGYELLSYQNATLTGPNKYNLTMLYRGGFGSRVADHPPGSVVASLTSSVGRFPITSSQIGQTVYFKFLAFNQTGGGVEDLALAPAYPYTIRGVGLGSTAVSGSVSGRPAAAAVVQTYIFMNSQVFPAGLVGSRGNAGTAATAIATFSIQKNGVAIGTMVFAAAATVATFTMATSVSFATGDVLTMVAPTSQDATLANVGWTLVSVLS